MKKKLLAIFANAKVRLAARALVVGAIVAYHQLKGHNVDRAAVEIALGAGGWAALEAFTPLNSLVGLLKQKPAA